jgi:hypothetical protein
VRGHSQTLNILALLCSALSSRRSRSSRSLYLGCIPALRPLQQGGRRHRGQGIHPKGDTPMDACAIRVCHQKERNALHASLATFDTASERSAHPRAKSGIDEGRYSPSAHGGRSLRYFPSAKQGGERARNLFMSRVTVSPMRRNHRATREVRRNEFDACKEAGGHRPTNQLQNTVGVRRGAHPEEARGPGGHHSLLVHDFRGVGPVPTHLVVFAMGVDQHW